MASESAITTAKEFCGGALYDTNKMYARETLAGVPTTEEGLRMLAANGSWSEVLVLAEKLDDHTTAKARRHPTRYATVPLAVPPTYAVASMARTGGTEMGGAVPVAPQEGSPALSPAPEGVSSSSSGLASPPLSPDAAVRNARLPFVLVQVTANLKMRRLVAAKKLIEELGDIEGDGFRHPTTRESFAPFSLRLIAAFLPLYLGSPMDAQKRLYALLEECLRCEKRCSDALHSDNSRGEERAGFFLSPQVVGRLGRTWAQRVLRVQRALLHVHIHLNQQSLAHSVVEQVLRAEYVWHRDFQVLSDDLFHLRHVLQLQQLFCLSLHIGNAQKAREVHHAIRQAASAPATSTASDSVVSNPALASLVATSCDAFTAVFHGDYTEAVRLFRLVVERCTEAKGSLAGDADRTFVPTADGSLSESALRRWVLQGICANAQVSQATCMAYCSDDEPTKSMEKLCATLEGYVKAEPQVLCNSDPFVESLVRFYTLAGERRGNLDRFSDVLEVFRCDRGALPSLDTLV